MFNASTEATSSNFREMTRNSHPSSNFRKQTIARRKKGKQSFSLNSPHLVKFGNGELPEAWKSILEMESFDDLKLGLIFNTFGDFRRF